MMYTPGFAGRALRRSPKRVRFVLSEAAGVTQIFYIRVLPAKEAFGHSGMTRLYHFSEEPGISTFVPRAPLAHAEQEPLVWAIDEWHSPHYFLPRDCPRVCYWSAAGSTLEDIGRLLSAATRVVAIEPAWLPAVSEGSIYRYEFDPDHFELVDATAGYYVCREAARPLGVERLSGQPALFARHGVDFRVVDDLLGLHQAVVASTLRFSSMRLRNADDPRAVTYR
jgi:hypothetical protein